MSSTKWLKESLQINVLQSLLNYGLAPGAIVDATSGEVSTSIDET
jgi:hypothetical protein